MNLIRHAIDMVGEAVGAAGPQAAGAANSAGAQYAGATFSGLRSAWGATPFTGGYSSSGTWAGGAASVATGALMGGAMSYTTGGSFTRGAIMGGIGGRAAARMAGSRTFSNVGRYLSGNAISGRARSFGSGLTSVGQMMENRANRNLVFGSGAMLSGAMFGGNRQQSRRRGFNAGRGNFIGHA